MDVVRVEVNVTHISPLDLRAIVLSLTVYNIKYTKHNNRHNNIKNTTILMLYFFVTDIVVCCELHFRATKSLENIFL